MEFAPVLAPFPQVLPQFSAVAAYFAFVCPDLRDACAALHVTPQFSAIPPQFALVLADLPVVSPQFPDIAPDLGPCRGVCGCCAAPIAARLPKNNPNMIFLLFIAVSPFIVSIR